MEEFLKTSKNEAVKSFWNKKNEKLDEDSKFLRDYIMNKRWLDQEAEEENENSVDKEDDELSLEVDHFEHEYNFRFENNKQTFTRNVQDTLRQETSKRKEERERLKLREKEKKSEIEN